MAYLYLKKLKSCECVNHNYSEKLAKTEHTLFILTSISLILAGLELFFKPQHLYNKYFNLYWIYSYVFFSVKLIVAAYFVYYTYQFQHTLQTNCKCANKWQKYYIYYQAIIYLIAFVLIFISFSVIILVENTQEFSIKLIKKLKKSNAQSHRMLYKY